MAINGSVNQSPTGLLKRLRENVARLARAEVDLAKSELTEKARGMAVGVALLAATVVLSLMALGSFTAAAIIGLSTAIAAWLAAFIVGLLVAVIAGVVALLGVNRLKQATPPAPTETVDSVKEDIEWLKTSAKQGSR